MKYLCRTKKSTIHLGERLGKTLRGGDVVLLSGGLGVGKTTFTKGIAKGMGIDAEVLSPTFVLMNLYGTDLKLCHIDAYRLKNGSEAIYAGLTDYIADETTVSVIEWHQNITEILPKNNLIYVNFFNASTNAREIEIVDK